MNQAWINKDNPYAYSGVSKVFHYLKGQKKFEDIKNELSENRTYTFHKEAKKVKKFNPLFIYKKHQQWQVDLVYLPNFINENEGNKYLMCVLEVFSRKLFVKVMKSKDKKIALETFSTIHKQIASNPEVLYSDFGGEFTSKIFRDYCLTNKIKQVFALNDTKAPHVERAQRSLQSLIYKIMEERQTRQFLGIIEEAVHIYNNRINRITGFSPNDAYLEQNSSSVLANLEKYYTRYSRNKKKPEFKVGDTVRIRNKKNIFERGYSPKFSEEVFKIRKVLTNLPQVRYAISNFNETEEIKGTFYERELARAKHEEYKIEKILQTRKRGKIKEHLVKWMGYSDEHNSWVLDKDLKSF